MSVQQELISVSRFAVTLLDLIHVTATVASPLMPMEGHVMVSRSLFACANSVIFDLLINVFRYK